MSHAQQLKVCPAAGPGARVRSSGGWDPAYTGASQAATLNIVTISPLSGDFSATGQEIRRTTGLAIKDQAAAFRTLGHSVVLVHLDDQRAPSGAAQEVKRVLADAGIVGVVGAYTSAVSNVVGHTTASLRRAGEITARRNDALTTQGWTHFYRLVPPDQAHAAALNYITGELRAHSVYVLSDNTGYGNGLTKAIINGLKKRHSEQAGYVGVSTDGCRGGVAQDQDQRRGRDLLRLLRKCPGPDDQGATCREGTGDVHGCRTLDSPSFVWRVGVDAEGAVNTTGFRPISIQVAQALRRTNLPACSGGTTSNCTTVSGAISFTRTGDRQRSRLLVMRFDKLLQPQVAKIYTISPESHR
ncbi:ABC transporter substrate-binding protein [Deinococcus navajonensis]|uniref:ABC transporter substrate-binding protein n=1 Tax=Deinococcus navajonensis TaxID=309884 RepID=A0ABV8XR31_9DEIO